MLIAAAPDRIDALASGAWRVGHTSYEADRGTVQFAGHTWARSGAHWTQLTGNRRFEWRGNRWIEWRGADQVAEIRISLNTVVYAPQVGRETRFHRHTDGSLRRFSEVPHRPRQSRQPSRFEERLTPGRLHNPVDN